jgi:hypothetical protein
MERCKSSIIFLVCCIIFFKKKKEEEEEPEQKVGFQNWNVICCLVYLLFNVFFLSFKLLFNIS